jgi:hypothetical protein
MAFPHRLSIPTKMVAGCILSAAWLWLPGCGSDSGNGAQSPANGGEGTATGGASAETGGSTATSAGAAGKAATTGGTATTTTGGTAATTGGVATSTGGTPATGGQATGGTSTCTPPATGGPTGMNDGMPCLGCHASAQTPNMTVAGTVYTTAAGAAAVSGATVTITDNNGAVLHLVTGSTGNFYSSSAVAFPASVSLSKCPDTASMSSQPSTGDCNSCHGSSMRIHLP